MSRLPDDRAPFAVAAHWVSRIVTVAVEMVAPGLVGVWLDRRFGSLPLLTLIGFATGVTMAIWHLLQMTGGARGNGSAGNGTGQDRSP